MFPELTRIRIPWKIRELEDTYGIHILHAAENGSRAWGTASKDSDFDVRFVYIRPRNEYLRLDETRDFMELPVSDGWDMSGWDLAKALRLLHGSNPRIYDWFLSPIYYTDDAFARRIQPLLEECFCVKTVSNHYWHQADNRIRGRLQGEEVRAKDYVYAVHFTMQCGWILDHCYAPPLDYDRLMEDQLPETIAPLVEKLRRQKMEHPEIKLTARQPILDDLLQRRLKELSERIQELPRKKDPDWGMLNEFFLAELARSEEAFRQEAARTFSGEEQRYFAEQMNAVLGTEGLGYDADCSVDTEVGKEEIRWNCGYSVDGYNYCAETEYTKTVTLQVADPEGNWADFEPVSDILVGIDCQGVEELLDGFAYASDSVRMRLPEAEKVRRLVDHAEFLFENLCGTGKTVLVRYRYTSSEPF